MSNAIFYADTNIFKTEKTVFEKYSFIAYLSLMFLGVGEIAPVTDLEYGMAFILLTFAFLVN